MTNYVPPRDTALGVDPDATPAEQLAQFVDDVTQPGCYALRLSKPQHERLEVLWSQEYDVLHPDIDAMQDSDRLYYVSGAKNLLARINDHLDNPNRSGAVMSVAPIHSIAHVWPYDSAEKAFEKESHHAIEMNQHPRAYVSQH